jgi:hypothetical protein
MGMKIDYIRKELILNENFHTALSWDYDNRNRAVES